MERIAMSAKPRNALIYIPLTVAVCFLIHNPIARGVEQLNSMPYDKFIKLVEKRKVQENIRLDGRAIIFQIKGDYETEYTTLIPHDKKVVNELKKQESGSKKNNPKQDAISTNSDKTL